MLLSARFTAQRLASTGVRCLSAGEIPVNTVCRVVSMNVGDEATALKMDEIVNTYKTEVLSTVPGFTGLERKVCKSEWDYSTTMHFENIDSLVAYLEDETLQAKANEVMAQGAEILGGADRIHRQNFVVDDM